MAALTNLANGTGYIYITDYDGTSVISSVPNTTNSVRKILEDASFSGPLPPNTGIYSTSYGRRYFLNSGGGAVQGDLTGATEISRNLILRGLESTLPVNSYTIAAGVVTPLRDSSIMIVNIDTEGAAASDTLDTITTTDYNTGDIIIFRGVSGSRIVTFSDNTGNLRLANGINFETKNLETAIALQYVSGSGFVELWRTPGITLDVSNMRSVGIAIPVQGANKTTLTAGGGTINIEAGIDKGYQIYDGSAVLAGSWVIQPQLIPATPYLDGDEIIVDYRSTLTAGANTVTIFGITLTSTQALEGRVMVLAKYKLSNTTWYASIFYKANGIDVPSLAYVDATFEDALGNPAADDYVLTSTAAGVRSWQPVFSTGVLYFDGATVGTGANLTPTTLKTYTVAENTLNDTDEALYVSAGGYTAANANTKTIELMIGGQLIIANGIITAPNNDYWKIEGHIYRTSATTARSTFNFYFADNATAAPTIEIYENTIAGLDWTSAQALIVRGTNGVAVANDIQSVSLGVHKIAKQS